MSKIISGKAAFCIMEEKAMAMGAKIELSVPAAQEMMLVIRLTTAAAMARSGISADGMDDMKMAVEEAANCLMQTSCISGIHMSFSRTPDGASVVLCADESAGETRTSGRAISPDEIAVVRCVLETMADEVELCEDDGCVRRIALVKKKRNV